MEAELNKLDAVLEKLQGVRITGGRYTAKCPAHDDRTPSLSVWLGDKWVMLKCFAGCEYDAIRRAMGLEWKDLVLDEDAPATRRRPIGQRELELTSMACCLRLQNEPEVLLRMRYGRGWAAQAFEMLGVGWDGSRLTLPVRDAAGKLHDVLRYDPFTKQGRKVLAGKGKSRLPFPAPETVDTRILFLVEGEGTAISMLSVGLHAVGLPGSLTPSYNVSRPGAWRGTGWHKKWAERFTRFQHLVLLPDCDGQGRALMGGVRYDLEKSGARVSIVDLGPRNNDGSDVADMLLSKTYDGASRLAAKTILREIVAEQAEVLVA
jgi:hypothetical protein